MGSLSFFFLLLLYPAAALGTQVQSSGGVIHPGNCRFGDDRNCFVELVKSRLLKSHKIDSFPMEEVNNYVDDDGYSCKQSIKTQKEPENSFSCTLKLECSLSDNIKKYLSVVAVVDSSTSDLSTSSGTDNVRIEFYSKMSNVAGETEGIQEYNEVDNSTKRSMSIEGYTGSTAQGSESITQESQEQEVYNYITTPSQSIVPQESAGTAILEAEMLLAAQGFSGSEISAQTGTSASTFHDTQEVSNTTNHSSSAQADSSVATEGTLRSSGLAHIDASGSGSTYTSEGVEINDSALLHSTTGVDKVVALDTNAAYKKPHLTEYIVAEDSSADAIRAQNADQTLTSEILPYNSVDSGHSTVETSQVVSSENSFTGVEVSQDTGRTSSNSTHELFNSGESLPEHATLSSGQSAGEATLTSGGEVKGKSNGTSLALENSLSAKKVHSTTREPQGIAYELLDGGAVLSGSQSAGKATLTTNYGERRYSGRDRILDPGPLAKRIRLASKSSADKVEGQQAALDSDTGALFAEGSGLYGSPDSTVKVSSSDNFKDIVETSDSGERVSNPYFLDNEFREISDHKSADKTPEERIVYVRTEDSYPPTGVATETRTVYHTSEHNAAGESALPNEGRLFGIRKKIYDVLGGGKGIDQSQSASQEMQPANEELVKKKYFYILGGDTDQSSASMQEKVPVNEEPVKRKYFHPLGEHRRNQMREVGGPRSQGTMYTIGGTGGGAVETGITSGSSTREDIHREVVTDALAAPVKRYVQKGEYFCEEDSVNGVCYKRKEIMSSMEGYFGFLEPDKFDAFSPQGEFNHANISTRLSAGVINTGYSQGGAIYTVPPAGPVTTGTVPSTLESKKIVSYDPPPKNVTQTTSLITPYPQEGSTYTETSLGVQSNASLAIPKATEHKIVYTKPQNQEVQETLTLPKIIGGSQSTASVAAPTAPFIPPYVQEESTYSDASIGTQGAASVAVPKMTEHEIVYTTSPKKDIQETSIFPKITNGAHNVASVVVPKMVEHNTAYITPPEQGIQEILTLPKITSEIHSTPFVATPKMIERNIAYITSPKQETQNILTPSIITQEEIVYADSPEGEFGGGLFTSSPGISTSKHILPSQRTIEEANIAFPPPRGEYAHSTIQRQLPRVITRPYGYLEGGALSTSSLTGSSIFQEEEIKPVKNEFVEVMPIEEVTQIPIVTSRPVKKEITYSVSPRRVVETILVTPEPFEKEIVYTVPPERVNQVFLIPKEATAQELASVTPKKLPRTYLLTPETTTQKQEVAHPPHSMDVVHHSPAESELAQGRQIVKDIPNVGMVQEPTPAPEIAAQEREIIQKPKVELIQMAESARERDEKEAEVTSSTGKEAQESVGIAEKNEGRGFEQETYAEEADQETTGSNFAEQKKQVMEAEPTVEADQSSAATSHDIELEVKVPTKETIQASTVPKEKVITETTPEGWALIETSPERKVVTEIASKGGELIEMPAENVVTVATPEVKESIEMPPKRKVVTVVVPEKKASIEAPSKRKVTTVVVPEKKVVTVAAPKEKVSVETPSERRMFIVAAPKEKVSVETPSERRVFTVAAPKEKVSAETPSERRVLAVAVPEEKVSAETPSERRVVTVAAPERRTSTEIMSPKRIFQITAVTPKLTKKEVGQKVNIVPGASLVQVPRSKFSEIILTTPKRAEKEVNQEMQFVPVIHTEEVPKRKAVHLITAPEIKEVQTIATVPGYVKHETVVTPISGLAQVSEETSGEFKQEGFIPTYTLEKAVGTYGSVEPESQMMPVTSTFYVPERVSDNFEFASKSKPTSYPEEVISLVQFQPAKKESEETASSEGSIQAVVIPGLAEKENKIEKSQPAKKESEETASSEGSIQAVVIPGLAEKENKIEKSTYAVGMIKMPIVAYEDSEDKLPQKESASGTTRKSKIILKPYKQEYNQELSRVSQGRGSNSGDAEDVSFYVGRESSDVPYTEIEARMPAKYIQSLDRGHSEVPKKLVPDFKKGSGDDFYIGKKLSSATYAGADSGMFIEYIQSPDDGYVKVGEELPPSLEERAYQGSESEVKVEEERDDYRLGTVEDSQISTESAEFPEGRTIKELIINAAPKESGYYRTESSFSAPSVFENSATNGTTAPSFIGRKFTGRNRNIIATIDCFNGMMSEESPIVESDILYGFTR